MYTTEQKLEMYELLVLMRRYNDAVAASVANGGMYGLHHLGTGEECIEVAAACAAEERDWITGENRWRAHWIKGRAWPCTPPRNSARKTPLTGECARNTTWPIPK